MSARRGRGLLVTAALVGAIAALLTLQIAGSDDGGRPVTTEQPASSRPAARTSGSLRIGVTTLALAQNSYRDWTAADLREVDAWERQVRRRTDIVMWFADWQHVPSFDARQAAAIAARGAAPEISWEPWDSLNGTPDQPGYRLSAIIRGDFDRHIDRWARGIAAYGRPVRLRFAQEMNGRWFPWAERANGNRRGEFVRAWRHVRAIFDRAGAKNVVWVWCPVAGSVRRDQYPGDDQVDVLGLAGFNGGTVAFRQEWRTFPTAFGPTLDYVHAMAPSKPVELSEIGSAEEGGSKAAWISGMFAEVRRRPYIRSLVWFDVRKEADWRLASSAAAGRAFASELSRAS